MEILKCEGIKKVYGSGNNQVVALDGIDLSVEKGEAAAQSRMEWWISQIPLPAEPVTVQTVCREKEIQIKAEGNILPIWSRNAWEYSVLSESRRNNPVKTIRKIRAVKQIWNQK